MAELTERLPRNVAGPYYIDSTCVDCDQCRSTAPNVFTRDDETGMSYVHRQPAAPDELARAEEARMECPTESIGRES